MLFRSVGVKQHLTLCAVLGLRPTSLDVQMMGRHTWWTVSEYVIRGASEKLRKHGSSSSTTHRLMKIYSSVNLSKFSVRDARETPRERGEAPQPATAESEIAANPLGDQLQVLPTGSGMQVATACSILRPKHYYDTKQT